MDTSRKKDAVSIELGSTVRLILNDHGGVHSTANKWLRGLRQVNVIGDRVGDITLTLGKNIWDPETHCFSRRRESWVPK